MALYTASINLLNSYQSATSHLTHFKTFSLVSLSTQKGIHGVMDDFIASKAMALLKML